MLTNKTAYPCNVKYVIKNTRLVAGQFAHFLSDKVARRFKLTWEYAQQSFSPEVTSAECDTCEIWQEELVPN